MRASGVSELRKFLHLLFLKLLFPSIFCWYFRYFVGTNDILVGLHVPTVSKCTDKTPKKDYWEAITPLPPPPLATLVLTPLCTLVYTQTETDIGNEHINQFSTGVTRSLIIVCIIHATWFYN